MSWETLEQGFICQKASGARGTEIAVGPRLAVLPSGEIVCSFMLTAKTATNDFVPVLCRSHDGGCNWSEPAVVWPQLSPSWSIFSAISLDRYSHRLYLYGTRCKIDAPGEPNWSTVTQGLKANKLIWAVSEDGGRSWSEPNLIPMPVPGSAEAPGPLCVTKSGRWVACYAPGNTFDPLLKVDRQQIVALLSDDQGRSWRHNSMLSFPQPAGGAEAWVIELANGCLLGTSWVIPDDGHDSENAFALSADGGTTWSKTNFTGTLGQTTALCALPDNRAIFLYNQRKHGDPGVRAALVNPTGESFGIEFDDYIWKAETRTQSMTSGDLNEWSDFSFGEPGMALLPDGTLLAAIWCIQPSGSGIRYVKLRLRS